MYAKEKERHKNSRKNYNYLWLPYSLLLLGVPFQVGLSAVSFLHFVGKKGCRCDP